MPNKFSYEKAMHEIESIIDEIENETLNMDELSDKVKQVSQLIKGCKMKLVDTKAEVDQLLKDLEH